MRPHTVRLINNRTAPVDSWGRRADQKGNLKQVALFFRGTEWEACRSQMAGIRDADERGR